MPDLLVPAIAVTSLVAVIALLLGWSLRGSRCKKEKHAISAGWRHQLAARQTEQDRVVAQNAHLMEQVNQLQTATKDLRQRARELAEELQQARELRDQLNRQLREIRGNLELAVAQRDRARADTRRQEKAQQAITATVRDRDGKIDRLRRELEKWSERVPPLLERYRARDLEAQQLEIELARARDRIVELEGQQTPGETRIEPVERSPLHALDASNDQYEETPDPGAAAPTDLTGDDLQRIKGIGPSIERTLKAAGIYSCKQLANLDDAEIGRVAEHLRGFRSRIFREDWIGQARALQAGEPLHR